ncbi:CopG family transcriptional regulator [Candidatus Azambacteria bacterium]|nr:CopG family transcriptional regulator [Candidatus Azambacteria bacterium]
MINRKILSISLPPKIEKELQKMAKKEEKTKSGVIREALKLYFNKKQQLKK